VARREVIVGLDVGTHKVAAVAGEVRRDGTLAITGVGIAPCRGMRKGVVIDLESTVRAIGTAVEQVERMAGLRCDAAVVAVGGSHVAATAGRGVVVVAREDREVTVRDVERVVEAARPVDVSPDREVLHVLPRGFTLDGSGGIRDPVGMLGQRLEVEANVVTAGVTAVQNLLRCVYRAGLAVEDVVLAPLAAAEAVLTHDQRELGVGLVDLGAGTTGVAVFDAAGLQHVAVLPVGGDHITGDLAVGLRSPLGRAEALKVAYGLASEGPEPQGQEGLGQPEQPERPEQSRRGVNPRAVAGIVGPRVQEILYLVDQVLRQSGRRNLLGGGVVVTGGGALLRGLVPAMEEALELPVQVATARGVAGLGDLVATPALAVAAGLVRYAAGLRLGSEVLGAGPAVGGEGARDGGWMVGMVGRVRNWLRELL